MAGSPSSHRAGLTLQQPLPGPDQCGFLQWACVGNSSIAQPWPESQGSAGCPLAPGHCAPVLRAHAGSYTPVRTLACLSWLVAAPAWPLGTVPLAGVHKLEPMAPAVPGGGSPIRVSFPDPDISSLGCQLGSNGDCLPDGHLKSRLYGTSGSMIDHNRWSLVVLRTMPCMRELDRILGPKLWAGYLFHHWQAAGALVAAQP